MTAEQSERFDTIHQTLYSISGNIISGIQESGDKTGAESKKSGRLEY
ncbi:MAG: hypothetical protein IPM36_08205 [Lewinellaceae bacterium]|jgi:hypothetical protein|nr:hypothetical protein [Lewinellaceae bacterium]